MTDAKEEQGKLLAKDADLLEEMAFWLRHQEYKICSCGDSGEVEREKVAQLAPKVIKAVANYI